MFGIPERQSPLDVDIPEDGESFIAILWKEEKWLLIAVCLLVFLIGQAEAKQDERRRTPERPMPLKRIPFPPQYFTPVTSSSKIPLRTPLPLLSDQVSPLSSHVPESALFDFSRFPPTSTVHERCCHLDPDHKGLSIISYEELRPYLGVSLANGDFGNVLRLSGVFTGYCLKMFKYGSFHRQECIKEAQIMQRLAHLKIPKLKGICLEPPGIVMSCHQTTLQHWIIHVRPTPMEALDALIQLCHILKDLHQEVFCHNDIKWNNVIIDRDEKGIHVILVDFGIASTIGTRTFFRGRSLGFSEAVACLVSSSYRSFYAPLLYIGLECSPSTDAFALAHLTRWVIARVGIRGPRLENLLQQYSRSFGHDCSVDALLKEMEAIWDEAHKWAPDITNH